uniref:Uncharacterized protein n=1 Tax=Musa acuminata TaxID=4641 RepID=Q1ENU7_MUSAC|nr:hypothetical protein MA4_82I11.40 [Musa acuminata]
MTTNSGMSEICDTNYPIAVERTDDILLRIKKKQNPIRNEETTGDIRKAVAATWVENSDENYSDALELKREQSGEAAHLHPGPVSGRRSPDRRRNGSSTARARRAQEGSDVGEMRDASHRVLSSLCTSLALALSGSSRSSNDSKMQNEIEQCGSRPIKKAFGVDELTMAEREG